MAMITLPSFMVGLFTKSVDSSIVQHLDYTVVARYQEKTMTKPTLIKDIMSEMEVGDRTKEQLIKMRMEEFNGMHRPSPVWATNGSTAIMMSSGAVWATNTIGGTI
jgi:hypothetical protein